MKNVVVIGGGTGLSTILRGLRDYPLDLTAIVTMTDDGSSTGRLRKDFDILPPGDIRKCIAALSNNESLLIELFEHRFKKGIGLRGHKFGNLWISALKEMSGSFEVAVEETSRLLAVRGQVLPSTLQNVHLKAIFTDGKTISGETKIVKYGYAHKIKKITLSKQVKANKKAVEAIKKADLILVGPGSLYTSILPNFLLKEIKETFNNVKVPKIYIGNVSTERGETDGFGLREHCRVLKSYGVEFNNTISNKKYFSEGSGDGFVSPVMINCDKCQGCRRFEADLVNKENPLYHDTEKLASFVWRTLKGHNLTRS
jgi:uncharacterized cofD-like protein